MATRIAFLNTHPIQYFAPLYAYLNRAPDLNVSAVYLSDYSIRGGYDYAFRRSVKWDIDLLDGYDAQFVGGAQRRKEPRGFFSMFVPQLVQHLAREKFDAVVIHGHSPAAMLVGAAAAKASGAAIFMRCDAHLGSPCSPFKAVLRRPLLGTLYSTFDGTLAIGTANAAFYRNMGVPQARIHSMPFTVDNERFTLQAGISTAERAAVRASLGVNDDRPIILYAAKFQLRKRPADLLYAAARLNGEVPPFRLVMAGSGELDGHLRSLVQSLRLENVHFVGFINQAALPKLYAASDIFVLPSENEPWGLAVNEAMCAGLPIVASNEVGCVSDLVHEGVNGHLHKAGNIEALASALRPLLSSRPEREQMGLASQEIISHWSYAECLHGLRQALASIGNHHEPAAAVAR